MPVVVASSLTASITFKLNMFFYVLSIIFAGLIIPIIAFIKRSHRYWTKRQVFQLEPTFIIGNSPAKGVHPSIFLMEFYHKIKRKGLKYGGLYTFIEPELLVTDLDLLKNIVVKDFEYFQTRGFNTADDDTSVKANLFRLSGERWKTLRSKLTPTFTSGKIKSMFSTLSDCLTPMKNRLETICKYSIPVDIKDLVGCYTTNVIGSCAFGLDCSTFDGEEESPFRTYGKKVFIVDGFDPLRRLIRNHYPKIAKFFKIQSVSEDVAKFFTNIVTDTVEMREKNNLQRQDFLQLLIDLKNEGVLKMHELVAQSFLFMGAGYETSSTATTFTMYLLGKNQDIQDKVRNEIQTVLQKCGGEVTYDTVQEMKYLDQVIDESLRLYPPGGHIPRRCDHQDYKIPNDNVIIEKGTLIWIPVYAIHHDEEIYPDPEKFDPDRFNEENKKSRHQFAFIPFGGGPRVCPAMRFGLLQTKLAIIGLLRDFKFTINKKTQEPLSFMLNSLTLSAKGNIWLDVEKI